MEHIDGIFASALKSRRSITEMDLVNLAPELDLNQKSGTDLIDRFRQLMEDCDQDPDQIGGFYDFATCGAEHNEEVRQQLIDGAIGAVDGTDRLSPMSFASTQLMVSGICSVTSQRRGDPEMHLTSTTSDLAGADLKDEECNDLWSIAEQMDEAARDGSWSTTIREYFEREVAADMPADVKTCLIDGPFFTQNLMTQQVARDHLLEPMLRDQRRYIGVIKGLDSSWSICRWAALALKKGEVYVVSTIRDAFTERLNRGGGGGAQIMAGWLERNASNFVRGVYRPNGKAFAFECALTDLPYAIALLRNDASPQINHEIPRLLQVVDQHCRSNNNAGQIKRLLLAQLQAKNTDMATQLSDERISR